MTQLNYKVIGVQKEKNGNISYDPKDFIRNSKDFGIPQNRPRVYIIGFDLKQYPDIKLPDHIPSKGKDTFSFPADVSDTQQYKLFGNSVTIPVIKEMAETVLKILKKSCN